MQSLLYPKNTVLWRAQPVHVMPFPVKPGLHSHSKLPGLFLQTAKGEQLLMPLLHSSTSVEDGGSRVFGGVNTGFKGGGSNKQQGKGPENA